MKKLTLEIHSADDILIRETLSLAVLRAKYGEMSYTKIQDMRKEELIGRLEVKGNFKSVMLFH